MAVRTAELGSILPAANTQTDVFTVPAGFTYLVKSVHVFNTGGALDTIFAFALHIGGADVGFYYSETLAATTTSNRQFYTALGPGAVFRVQSTTGTTHFWISGVKLPGVA